MWVINYCIVIIKYWDCGLLKHALIEITINFMLDRFRSYKNLLSEGSSILFVIIIMLLFSFQRGVQKACRKKKVCWPSVLGIRNFHHMIGVLGVAGSKFRIMICTSRNWNDLLLPSSFLLSPWYRTTLFRFELLEWMRKGTTDLGLQLIGRWSQR